MVTETRSLSVVEGVKIYASASFCCKPFEIVNYIGRARRPIYAKLKYYVISEATQHKADVKGIIVNLLSSVI